MSFSNIALKLVLILQLVQWSFSDAKAQVTADVWLKNVQSKEGVYLIPFSANRPERVFLQVLTVASAPGKIPPLELVKGDFIQSGVMNFLKNMDLMDRDLFYMKLQRASKSDFLKMTGTKKIPEKNALILYELMRRGHFKAFISVKDSKGIEIGFKNIRQPLKRIQSEDSGYQFFLESSTFKWISRRKTFIEISLP